ncbi:MAG: LysM peptidoglycan-binding domain-containing protein, partial [Actinobacteria bacterium]|nr:LysM peptidoglycan-binding domain-containing protein [Actinomycetota bacterium]
MKRIGAVFGLGLMLIASPAALSQTGGGPRVPRLESFGGLEARYVSLAPVLQALTLIAWIVWLYIFVVVLIRLLALAVHRRTGSDTLLRITDRAAPIFLRRAIDLAIGGAIVAASFASVRTSIAQPIRSAAVTQETEPRVSQSQTEAPRRPTYLVRDGDSLWRIAEKKLGSGFRWHDIYVLNRGRRFSDGERLANPRLIRPGWTIDLPEAATPLRHEDRKPSAQPERATSSPQEITIDRARPDHPAPTSTPSRQDLNHPASPPVIELPSGAVVATSFASGLLTAELLTRMRRRRRRRPASDLPLPEASPEIVQALRVHGAVASSGIADVAIEEIAAVFRNRGYAWPRVLAAVESEGRVEVIIEAFEEPLPPPSGGVVSPSLRFERKGSLVYVEAGPPFPLRLRRLATPIQRGLLAPVGHLKGRSVVHVAASGLGSVAISGDGSERVVENLILSLAAAAEQTELRVVIIGTPTAGSALEVPPHVSQRVSWDAAGSALQDLQAEFIRRARIFQQEGLEDIWAHLARHDDEQLEALLIIMSVPPPALRPVIEALAVEAPRFACSLVTVGWALRASRLEVDAGTDELNIRSDLGLPRCAQPLVLNVDAVKEAIELINAATTLDDEAPERSASREFSLEQSTPAQSKAEPERANLVPSLAATPPPGVAAIECLGPFRVGRDGNVRAKGWLKKSRELLAYLVAHPEGVTKERIWDELWPGEDPSRLQMQLDKTISIARTQTRTDNDFKSYIVKIEDAWRLEEGSWWVDAFEFSRSAQGAESCSDDALRIDYLRSAVNLYRGNFCDDLGYGWAEPVRERYRAMFVRACAQLSEMLQTGGDTEGSLEILERAIAVDSLCEDLWRRAMLIEASLGRRAAATARYERLHALLAAELDVEPDPETQQVMRSLAEDRRRVELDAE